MFVLDECDKLLENVSKYPPYWLLRYARWHPKDL